MITMGMLVFITKLPTMICPVKQGIGGLVVDSLEECGEGVTLYTVSCQNLVNDSSEFNNS